MRFKSIWVCQFISVDALHFKHTNLFFFEHAIRKGSPYVQVPYTVKYNHKYLNNKQLCALTEKYVERYREYWPEIVAWIKCVVNLP